MVGVKGQAVLETKGLDGDLQEALLPRHDVAIPAGQVVNEDSCIGCGDCLEECPMGAITEIVDE